MDPGEDDSEQAEPGVTAPAGEPGCGGWKVKAMPCPAVLPLLPRTPRRIQWRATCEQAGVWPDCPELEKRARGDV